MDPTTAPTVPTLDPTSAPTQAPSQPTVDPTSAPTQAPSQPTLDPTEAPTVPTLDPTSAPTVPTLDPTTAPTVPTLDPTTAPTVPTLDPTEAPTVPTLDPTSAPTQAPTECVIYCHGYWQCTGNGAEERFTAVWDTCPITCLCVEGNVCPRPDGFTRNNGRCVTLTFWEKAGFHSTYLCALQKAEFEGFVMSSFMEQVHTRFVHKQNMDMKY